MFLVGIGGPIKNTGTVGTAHPFRIARPAFSQHFIVTEGTTFSQAPTRHLCVLLVSEVLIVCLLGIGVPVAVDRDFTSAGSRNEPEESACTSRAAPCLAE